MSAFGGKADIDDLFPYRCRLKPSHLAKHFADDTVLSNAELSQLAEMTKEACQKMSDFVKACRVKPMIAGHSQRQIEQRRLTNSKANGR
jgi:DNA-binding MltR family transcriptional regulator